jgi:integrase/recombinase XerD
LASGAHVRQGVRVVATCPAVQGQLADPQIKDIICGCLMPERPKLTKVEDQGRKMQMDGIELVSGQLVRPVGADEATAVLWPARAAPLERLPGSSTDDPFLRLAAAWLIGHPTNTATAYRRDLQAWATWCAHLGTDPLNAERHHVDAWVRHLSTTDQPRTGRPASAATIARRLSALSGFYDFGVHDAGVLTHSPVASVRRPRVSDESQAVGLTVEQLQHLLSIAAQHSPRSGALVALLLFCGLRISEGLGADIRDYGHDQGHRVLRVVRKGGKSARIPLPPAVVRALDTYLGDRTNGPLFLAADGINRYPYKSAYEQLGRLCRTTGLPPGVSPHSLRHSYATEALRLGAALQDVQDALGHADPRTTRRYDRRRHDLDRSPNYLLATALTNQAPTRTAGKTSEKHPGTQYPA